MPSWTEKISKYHLHLRLDGLELLLGFSQAALRHDLGRHHVVPVPVRARPLVGGGQLKLHADLSIDKNMMKDDDDNARGLRPANYNTPRR